MLVPGWTWQTMQELEGMALVSRCWMGCPGSDLSMVGSTDAEVPLLPNFAYWRGVFGIEVVGVDDVAAGASGAAVIAGVIVGAGEGEEGVEEAGLLQAEEDGVGAEFGADAAIAEFDVGACRDLLRDWGCRFRGVFRRRVRRRAGCCRARRLPSAGWDRGRAGRLSFSVSSGVGGGQVRRRSGSPSGA